MPQGSFNTDYSDIQGFSEKVPGNIREIIEIGGKLNVRQSCRAIYGHFGLNSIYRLFYRKRAQYVVEDGRRFLTTEEVLRLIRKGYGQWGGVRGRRYEEECPFEVPEIKPLEFDNLKQLKLFVRKFADEERDFSPIDANEIIYGKRKTAGIFYLNRTGKLEFISGKDGKPRVRAKDVYSIIDEGKYGRWKNVKFTLTELYEDFFSMEEMKLLKKQFFLIARELLKDPDGEKNLQNLLERIEADDSFEKNYFEEELNMLKEELLSAEMDKEIQIPEPETPPVIAKRTYIYQGGIQEMMTDSDPKISRPARTIHNLLQFGELKKAEPVLRYLLGPSPLETETSRLKTFAEVIEALNTYGKYVQIEYFVNCFSKLEMFGEDVRAKELFKDLETLDDAKEKGRDHSISFFSEVGGVATKWKTMVAERKGKKN